MTEHQIFNQSEENELAVIGSILIQPEVINEAGELLTPADFIDQRNQAIFSAMLELSASGKPIDPVLLKSQLEKSGKLEEAGGTNYLFSVADRQFFTSNIKHYAAEVQRTALASTLLHSCQCAIGRIAEGQYEAARDDLCAILLSGQTKAGKVKHIKQALKDAHNPAKFAASGLNTGYFRLDENVFCGGIALTSMTVIAASTSVGKTQMAINLMRSLRKNGIGARVLFISLEMGEEEIIDRLTAMESGIPLYECKLNRIGKGKTASLTSPHYSGAIKKIAGTDHWLYDSGGLTPNKLRALVAANSGRVDVVILDYLQLIGSDNRGESDYSRVSEASRTCKQISLQFKIPTIALSQLARNKGKGEADNDTPAIPQLHHLRDSGQIEQDADNVLMLWREKKAGAKSEELRIYVRKNRNGAIGKLGMNIDLPTGLITDYNESRATMDNED